MTKKRGRRKSRVSECSSDSAAIIPAENVDIVDGLVPEDEWSNCLLDAYREESIHAWVRTKCELRVVSISNFPSYTCSMKQNTWIKLRITRDLVWKSYTTVHCCRHFTMQLYWRDIRDTLLPDQHYMIQRVNSVTTFIE